MLPSHWPWMCRYGVGKWRLIQKDEDYGPILTNRSNVDLKVSSCSAVCYRCSADGLAATLPECFAACCCSGAGAFLVLMAGYRPSLCCPAWCSNFRAQSSRTVDCQSAEASLCSQLLCPASFDLRGWPHLSAASAG